MSNTTTIQITTDQKAELDDLKAHDTEPYKSVIQRLIDESDGGPSEIADRVERLETAVFETD